MLYARLTITIEVPGLNADDENEMATLDTRLEEFRDKLDVAVESFRYPNWIVKVSEMRRPSAES